MIKHQLESFARGVLDTNGLQAWKFAFDDRTTHRLGQCRYSTKTISLSTYILRSVAEEQTLLEFCKDVILHEAAHALVGGGNGHNHVWKAKALELGCINPASKVNTVTEWGFKLYRAPSKDKLFTIVLVTPSGGLEAFGQRNTSDHIGQLYIAHRKRETYGKLLAVPTAAFKDYELGLATTEETIGAEITVEKQAAFKAATPTKAKTKSTYTAFTKSIYAVGMSFEAFTALYLASKPTAAANTLKAQYYRVQKDLG